MGWLCWPGTWEPIGETSSHTTPHRTPVHICLSSLSHCGLILDVKVWNCTHKLISTEKKKLKGGGEGAGGEWFIEPSPEILACEKEATNSGHFKAESFWLLQFSSRCYMPFSPTSWDFCLHQYLFRDDFMLTKYVQLAMWLLILQGRGATLRFCCVVLSVLVCRLLARLVLQRSKHTRGWNFLFVFVLTEVGQINVHILSKSFLTSNRQREIYWYKNNEKKVNQPIFGVLCRSCLDCVWVWHVFENRLF